MHKEMFLICFLIGNTLIGNSQQDQHQVILEKNTCYEGLLKKLQTDSLYYKVHSQFADTFEVLKNQKEYFGVPGYVQNKIDESLFLSKDGIACILIVLQKMADTLVFGSARIVSGHKQSNDKWIFTPGMKFYFEKDYFNLFKENNFQNISKLARYSVLTEGKIKRKGCAIDKHYWFTLLK